MLQSSNNPQGYSPNTFAPVRTVTTLAEQATIGRSLVIKGELSGEESVYIDGRVEGSIHFADYRVTIGRNGTVIANISAREVVIMGSVKGNVQCTDRVDIRAEGSLTGDIVTPRISVEDGALLKGSIQVRSADAKEAKSNEKKKEKPQTTAASDEKPKPEEALLTAVAGT